jgi:hypothetical protein
MQMVKKIFIAFFVLWFALLLFMPKQELYYKLEQALVKEGIKINEERIEEGVFSLTLKNADLYVKGIKIATVEKVNLFTLLFYTKVELSELLLDSSLKRMAPQRTQSATLSHTLLSPMHVSIQAEGSFGLLAGNADLKERKVHLDFVEEKEIDMIKQMLKKGEAGWYYETSF